MSTYQNIAVGDSIVFPKSCALVKGGVISSIKGLNGHAKQVFTTNGGWFVVSRYNKDYELTKAVN
jgi:hypothetical protein